MNNKLELFVKENRKAFDFNEPSADLWSKIENKLDSKKQKKPIKLYLLVSAAASIVLILGLAWLYMGSLQTRDINIADVNPAIAKKEGRYVGLIEEKRDSLAIFAAANPDLYKKFTDDLKKLDDDYERLKAELSTTPNQVLVVKAMVRNREIQLQVLKQQLMIINEVDDYKKVNQI